MDINIFTTVFALIFVAELPDKTAFATFLMATRGKPLAIFTGVAAAFVVQSFIAVCFGSLIGLLPEKWVHTGAGLLFLGFAAHTWLFHDKEEAAAEEVTPKLSPRLKFWSAVWKSFVVIFIAEWGDMTQLATASLAARYHGYPMTVFFSATLALWIVTVIAVFAGKKAKHALHINVLKNVSTVLFALVGVYFVASALFPVNGKSVMQMRLPGVVNTTHAAN